MRVFDFDMAIVREPGRSVVDGLRSNPGPAPDFDKVSEEHAAYVAALTRAGLKVDILPPLEAYPDSVFVEDPALVLPEGAIVLRPGAPSRLGEAAELKAALQRHYGHILELEGDEHADGGDVLVTPKTIFIGLSARTSLNGAKALVVQLASLGRTARIVETPPSVLHFKTAVSLLSEDAVLATRQMAASGLFPDMKVILVPETEEAAANALRINDAVLANDRFPRTLELLHREGFNVQALRVSETAKLDAGLSCMSLRWKRRR